MATVALTLPKPRRRPSHQPAAGRASFLEFYFLKNIDNSRLLREVDVEKRRECFALLGLAILVFLFGLLFAWQHFRSVRIGYQIEQLKNERASLDQWNHQLRLEQASLTDPQRIDTLAREHLGLAPPSADQVIQVSEEATSSPNGITELARNLTASGLETSREP